uniref:Uncharacterized protein n=1 Tax=Avena sativa TaxID=4498 RepID=A0ACD5XT26_AVESA
MSPLSTAAEAAAPSLPAMGLPGCDTRCGDVSVPYPFGIGPERCYLPGFKLTCVVDEHGNSTSQRLLLGDGGPFEVVHIFVENNTMRVVSHGLQAMNMSGSSNKHGRWSLGDIIGGAPVPYVVAPYWNEFILMGCNVQATLLRNGSGGFIVSGCASFCTAIDDWSNSPFDPDDDKICTNIGCCQATIPLGWASYGVELKPLDDGTPEGKVSVLIAEKGWFNENRTETIPITNTSIPHLNSPQLKDGLMVPVILWSTNSACQDAGYYTMSTVRGYYQCSCNYGYKGNPYLTHGCQDIKECDHKEKYGCFGDCEELPGSFRCRCPEGTYGNFRMPGGCILKSANTTTSANKNTGHSHLGLIIGLSVASGPCILLLVLGALLIIRDLKKRKVNTLRRKFFTQNRGQLLKQLVSHRTDIAERMLISLEELEKATNNFDPARRLGGGGHGTVYKGILSDLHVVAIKKSNIAVRREIDEFINEVAILSQINHRNIVKLRGCCLETEVPLLAYEFISSGTLSDHLHTEETKSLPWKDRLRITSEIGKALAYLHSAVSVPVIHRDIKPSNILLDDYLTAKVSDFGASRYIPMDQTGTSTAVQGTIGYLDPMYYYTRRLTETSDVYSFGVLLVELLTRRKPSLYRSSEGDGLVMQFVTLLAEGNLAELLDPQVVEEGSSEVKEVATLAASCVELKEEERPTMRQVELTLEALQRPMEFVQGVLTKETNGQKCASRNYPSTSQRAKRREASRCYSQEEEFLLSARCPR